MVQSPSLAALVFAMAIVACGCGGTQVGKPIVSYQRNAIAVPLMQTVSSAGLYTLFPGDGITPLEAVYLHPGDQYGFKSSEGKAAASTLKRAPANWLCSMACSPATTSGNIKGISSPNQRNKILDALPTHGRWHQS